MADNHYYFSFGSNMDRGQMKERTPNAEHVGTGYVEGYDIVFNRKGSYRLGGVSSIVPCEGVNAYGVVWSISDGELSELDRIEDPSAYERVTKRVTLTNRETIDCQVYVSFPQEDIAADQEYLEIIISAAQSAGLPNHWIERIKQYRS